MGHPVQEHLGTEKTYSLQQKMSFSWLLKGNSWLSTRWAQMKEYEKSKRTSHHWPSCANRFLRYRSSKSYFLPIRTPRQLWRHSRTTENYGKRKCNTRISSKWILLEILQVYRIRQHSSTCVQNPLPWQLKREQYLLLKRQKPIVYANVLTIFQLEKTQFIS